jgi:hypothetical protein
MYYCPFLADTIISPQHFTIPVIQDHRYNGYCLIDLLGCCPILMSYSHDNDASIIALQKRKYLYFIAGSTPSSSGHHVSHLSTKTQLLSELWHQCIGHPGPTQLSMLAKHSTGLPSQLTAGLYPMYYFQACNYEKIKRAPMGPTSDTDPLLSGTRFHLDFVLIHDSSADFGITPGNRVVISYDGNNTYLLIICAKVRHTWIFFKRPNHLPFL